MGSPWFSCFEFNADSVPFFGGIDSKTFITTDISAVIAFAFVALWVIGRVVDIITGLRVQDGEEVVGLDIATWKKAYGGISQ